MGCQKIFFYYCLFFNAVLSVSLSEYSSSVPVDSPLPREETFIFCICNTDSVRDICYKVECCHRRPDVFKEFQGAYNIQDGTNGN